MKLGRAIRFDLERKSKIFTLGIYIPFLSNKLAVKCVKEIANIFTDGKVDVELENRIIIDNLTGRQQHLQLMLMIFLYFDPDASKAQKKAYETAKDSFKKMFFRDYTPEHNQFIIDKINQFDSKIGEMIKRKDKGGEYTLLDVVIWVETILHPLSRKLSLAEFKQYYQIADKKNKSQQNGEKR